MAVTHSCTSWSVTAWNILSLLGDISWKKNKQQQQQKIMWLYVIIIITTVNCIDHVHEDNVYLGSTERPTIWLVVYRKAIPENSYFCQHQLQNKTSLYIAVDSPLLMDWAVLVPEPTTFHLFGLLWSTKNNKVDKEEGKKTDEGSFSTKKILWIHSMLFLLLYLQDHYSLV